jgi:hypothetical protein
MPDPTNRFVPAGTTQDEEETEDRTNELQQQDSSAQDTTGDVDNGDIGPIEQPSGTDRSPGQQDAIQDAEDSGLREFEGGASSNQDVPMAGDPAEGATRPAAKQETLDPTGEESQGADSPGAPGGSSIRTANSVGGAPTNTGTESRQETANLDTTVDVGTENPTKQVERQIQNQLNPVLAARRREAQRGDVGDVVIKNPVTGNRVEDELRDASQDFQSTVESESFQNTAFDVATLGTVEVLKQGARRTGNEEAASGIRTVEETGEEFVTGAASSVNPAALALAGKEGFEGGVFALRNIDNPGKVVNTAADTAVVAGDETVTQFEENPARASGALAGELLLAKGAGKAAGSVRRATGKTKSGATAAGGASGGGSAVAAEINPFVGPFGDVRTPLRKAGARVRERVPSGRRRSSDIGGDRGQLNLEQRRSNRGGSSGTDSSGSDDTVTITGSDISSTRARSDVTRGGRMPSGTGPVTPGRRKSPKKKGSSPDVGGGESVSNLGFRSAETELETGGQRFVADTDTSRVGTQLLSQSGAISITGRGLPFLPRDAESRQEQATQPEVTGPEVDSGERVTLDTVELNEVDTDEPTLQFDQEADDALDSTVDPNVDTNTTPFWETDETPMSDSGTDTDTITDPFTRDRIDIDVRTGPRQEPDTATPVDIDQPQIPDTDQPQTPDLDTPQTPDIDTPQTPDPGDPNDPDDKDRDPPFFEWTLDGELSSDADDGGNADDSLFSSGIRDVDIDDVF